MQLDVITIGEPMVLFAAQQPGALHEVETFTRLTAGAELNVTIGLRRLGLHVGYVSRLGRDSFGRFLEAALDREGIDRRHVITDDEHPTGFMLKSRASDGSDPQIEYFRRGSAASQLGVADNPRLAALSDWVMPGLAEGRLLTGRETPESIAAFYLERGASRVTIKLGHFAGPQLSGYVPGVAVPKVVDTSAPATALRWVSFRVCSKGWRLPTPWRAAMRSARAWCSFRAIATGCRTGRNSIG